MQETITASPMTTTPMLASSSLKDAKSARKYPINRRTQPWHLATSAMVIVSTSQGGLVYDSSVYVFYWIMLQGRRCLIVEFTGWRPAGSIFQLNARRGICLINCSQSRGPLFAVLHTPGEVTK